MYKQLHDGEYTALRQSALRTKGSSEQRALIVAARESAKFIKYMRDQVAITDGDELPQHEEKMTEQAFKDAPQDTEQTVYASLRSLTPALACRPTLWGALTLKHIENGYIESSYLAANGGSLPGGLKRIDAALASDDAKEIDACVRTLFRRFSGLPEARGHKSVYVNCSFGRAWWREHLCEQICHETGAVRSDVLVVLRLSQQYWEELISLLVSRNSIIGDRKTRDVLVWFLTETKKTNPSHNVFKSKQLRKFCRILGMRSAWQEIGMLAPDELKQVLEQEIKFC